jgi:hypothetical protein
MMTMMLLLLVMRGLRAATASTPGIALLRLLGT